jgi:hypothetical protein
MTTHVWVDLDEKSLEIVVPYRGEQGYIYFEEGIGYFFHESVDHFCSCDKKAFFSRDCQCAGYANVIARKDTLEKVEYKGNII